MRKRSLSICLLCFLMVSCNEHYYYVESTIDPYTVHNFDMERTQVASLQNSFPLKAKNDDDAKQKAEQLFQNRVKNTPLKDFNSRIINSYSLRKGDYFGIEIARNTIIPGIDHTTENKEKAFDQINFGDKTAKVKEYYNPVLQPSKEEFTCVFIGGKPQVIKGGLRDIQPNYSLETQTLTTKINIKDYSFTATFLFWRDQLYRITLLSNDSFASMQDASRVYFQLRELVYLANGFPSWIRPIEEPSVFSKRIHSDDSVYCGWVFESSAITLGFVERNDTYRIAYYATSSTISNEMVEIVENYAKEDKNRKEMKDKEWEEKASILF